MNVLGGNFAVNAANEIPSYEAFFVIDSNIYALICFNYDFIGT